MEEPLYDINSVRSMKRSESWKGVECMVSQYAKKKIDIILADVDKFTDLEKLFLYLRLPTGSNEEYGNNKESRSGTPTMTVTRAEQTHAFNWIRSHLEESQSTSLPKHEVYEDYRSFCESSNHSVLSAADFGKIIKCVFPTIKARRLGTRGNSKYCYSGIRKKSEIKPPSLPILDLPDNTPDSMTDPDKNTPCNCNHHSNQQEEDQTMSAASFLVCEWAQKLLGRAFDTLLDLARYLVGSNCVSTKSMAAFTVLADMQMSSKTPKAGLGDFGIVRRPPSIPPHQEARKQLQRKIQERKILKFQREMSEQHLMTELDTKVTEKDGPGTRQHSVTFEPIEKEIETASSNRKTQIVKVKPNATKNDVEQNVISTSASQYPDMSMKEKAIHTHTSVPMATTAMFMKGQSSNNGKNVMPANMNSHSNQGILITEKNNMMPLSLPMVVKKGQDTASTPSHRLSDVSKDENSDTSLNSTDTSPCQPVIPVPLMSPNSNIGVCSPVGGHPAFSFTPIESSSGFGTANVTVNNLSPIKPTSMRNRQSRQQSYPYTRKESNVRHTLMNATVATTATAQLPSVAMVMPNSEMHQSFQYVGEKSTYMSGHYHGNEALMIHGLSSESSYNRSHSAPLPSNNTPGAWQTENNVKRSLTQILESDHNMDAPLRELQLSDADFEIEQSSTLPWSQSYPASFEPPSIDTDAVFHEMCPPANRDPNPVNFDLQQWNMGNNDNGTRSSAC
ncbi:uncharacterized protein LOC144356507 [Saccoglossus kowalevskii]